MARSAVALTTPMATGDTAGQAATADRSEDRVGEQAPC